MFSSAAPWDEYSTCAKVLSVYITLGAAYVLRDQGHIRVDVFYTRLTLRTRATIDLATSILFFLFCIALLLMGLDKAGAELARLRPSLRVLAPPSWPVGLITSAAISLLLFQGLAKFIRDLVTAITGKEIT